MPQSSSVYCYTSTASLFNQLTTTQSCSTSLFPQETSSICNGQPYNGGGYDTSSCWETTGYSYYSTPYSLSSSCYSTVFPVATSGTTCSSTTWYAGITPSISSSCYPTYFPQGYTSSSCSYTTSIGPTTAYATSSSCSTTTFPSPTYQTTCSTTVQFLGSSSTTCYGTSFTAGQLSSTCSYSVFATATVRAAAPPSFVAPTESRHILWVGVFVSAMTMLVGNLWWWTH
jgi:hypothetical protein